MQVKYRKTFEKEISKVRLQSVLEEIGEHIKVVKECKTLLEFTQLPAVTKLVGHKGYYRIKFGDYRIGVKVVDNVIHFVRFGIRSKIYNIFP